MYCSTCGNSVNENLNYCNACGAKIGKNLPQIRNAPSAAHSIAAGFFGMFGLFAFIRLLQILLNSRLEQPAIFAILIVYLIVLFLLCSVIAGNVFRRSNSEKTGANQSPEDYTPPKQMHAVSTNQLEEPREPFIGSVTENTTRTFDKVPRT